MKQYHIFKASRPTKKGIKESLLWDKVAESLLEWDGFSTYSKEELISEFQSAHTSLSEFYGDGYEVAKMIENAMYINPDSHLVDICDGLHWIPGSELRKRVRQWVIDCEITPTLEPGKFVKTRIRTGDGEVDIYGQIEEMEDFNIKDAVYTVRVIGGKYDGKRYLLPFEKVVETEGAA